VNRTETTAIRQVMISKEKFTEAVGDIGGLAIGIGSAIVIIAIIIIIVGSISNGLGAATCGTYGNASCIGNYTHLLYSLEGYAQTSIGMVMLGVLVAAAMFIVWLVGGGGGR
jgi:hypothetical protein